MWDVVVDQRVDLCLSSWILGQCGLLLDVELEDWVWERDWRALYTSAGA